MNRNLARLNHVLIPTTKLGRDRLRERWASKLFVTPLAKTYFALSEEGRVLLACAALAGFAGMDVERGQSHVLWALLLSLILASLAVRRFFPLSGVRIRAEGPDRVTLGRAARFQLTLENRGRRDQHGVRIRGPFLPWDGKWNGPAPSIATLPAGQRRTLAVTARFAARGPHHLDPFAAAALLPLGLAVGPHINTTGIRFTVVPQLARVRHIALPSSPRYQPGGVALASLTGESMELMGVRPYRQGDRIRDLHVRTWARTGEPAVREYQQEYFSRVGVVLDTDLGSADEERLETAISLVAGIIARLSRGEALIDLLVTGDQLHPLTLGRSLGHLDQALDHLACVAAGPRFDTGVTMSLLRPHLPRLSSLVFVAIDWNESRRALVRGILEGGVGCRSLVISDDAGSDVPADVDALRVAEVQDACGSGPDLVL